MGARTLAFPDGTTVAPSDGVAVYPVWSVPAGRFPETPPPWSAPGVFCVAPDGVAVLSRECWPRLPDFPCERIEGLTIARVDSARGTTPATLVRAARASRAARSIAADDPTADGAAALTLAASRVDALRAAVEGGGPVDPFAAAERDLARSLDAAARLLSYLAAP